MNEEFVAHYFDYLFFVALSEQERSSALRAAGITVPGELQHLKEFFPDWRGSQNWIYFREWFRRSHMLAAWLRLHRSIIAPPALRLLLQRVNLSNDSIFRLISDEDLTTMTTTRLPTLRVRITVPRSLTAWDRSPRRWDDWAWEDEEVPSGDGILLTHLAAGSAMMTEMFVALGGSISMIGPQPPAPPTVEVAPGSVSFTVAGGMLASGIGLIVACCEGLLPEALPGIAGGTALASAGLIELAIDWRKKVAEVERIREESRISQLEHNYVDMEQKRQIQELEIRKKEIELQVLRIQAQGTSLLSGSPSVGLFDPEQIARAAEDWGVTLEFAAHLLNQGVPTYLAVRRYFENVEVERGDPEMRPKASSAGA